MQSKDELIKVYVVGAIFMLLIQNEIFDFMHMTLKQ
jgi:hypothetical protein